MAPRIQPASLYQLGLSAVSLQVDTACTNIFLEHGCYGNQDCVDAMKELQDFLVGSLPTTVFVHLAEDRNGRNRSQHLWSKDPRIKLGVFLHPSIHCFNVDAKGNELMQQQDDGLDEYFWCSQLRRLNNLVHLNLNLITTDQILLLVGQSCPKLEVINIVSRIKQDTMMQDPSIFPGPAITLKFCVSDLGLQSLLKCKRLRKITMNKVVNCNPANRGISVTGVRDLVQKLPDLESINFGSIGKVLRGIDCQRLESGSDPVDPLKLTYFSEMDPAFVCARRLQRLCPFIQHISLSVPININCQGFLNTNNGPCNRILNELAESDLKLRVVELQHFPFGEPFKNLLRSKGMGIEDLVYRSNTHLHSEHIVFIGEHCPGLQKLHLKEVGPEENPYPNLLEIVYQKRLFAQLSVLHLSGRNWSPNVILPTLLAAATKIANLNLLNLSCRVPMDGAVHQLLQHNKLSELASLSLYSGCFLSMQTIRQLTYDLTSLNSFYFLQFDDIDISDVEALRAEVVKKNLDVKLCCLELSEL